MPVIGTAGHVDHGKSALVQALTGIDPDRLREEKERGLTIDLGFAWLTLPSGQEVGIVDVPGHERFIKNMLAGAGGVDLALLVVAADEGPRQQTREHLAILDLLEVPAGLVVVTKCDLVEAEYVDLVEAEIEEQLAGSRLAGGPILRVSAVTGAGLDDLRTAIDAALANTPEKRDTRRARLPIDRVFTVKGFGAVVTGTLLDGLLEVGEEVEVVPSGAKARVRGLQRHRTKVQTIAPGNRVAVNLAGVHEEDLHRGMTIATPGRVKPAGSVVARLAASRILSHPLAHDAEVTVMCATAETQAKVRLLDRDALDGSGEAWAQFVFATEIPAVPGDHVIVRSPNETVAGGRIVTVNGRRLRRNDAATLELLHRRLEGTPESRIEDALRAGPRTLEQLAADIGAIDFVAATIAEMKVAGDVSERDGRYFSADWSEYGTAQLERAIRTFLAANPLRGSAPKEHVRSAVRLDAPVFELPIDLALANGTVTRAAGGLCVAGHEVRLSAAQQSEVAAFLTALRGAPYSPPTEGLPAPPLLGYLAERSEVVDTGVGVVFAAEAFREMTDRVREHIEANGAVSMAEVRDLFGTSRKYAQAFLEHLDALHITRRNGDLRTLL